MPKLKAMQLMKPPKAKRTLSPMQAAKVRDVAAKMMKGYRG